jgi:hypothetical protein
VDDSGAIAGVVGGSAALVSLVGWFARNAFAAVQKTLERIESEVKGQGERLGRVEERAQGRHENTMRLLDEHGRRIGALEDGAPKRSRR